MTEHTATITVTVTHWDEDRVVSAAEQGPDAEHAVAHATYTTTLAGDLDGTSTATLLISYLSGAMADPCTLTGPYVGYEMITGTIAGRSGTFVTAVRGSHGAGSARTDLEVVPGSGTGGLTGITGTGSYTAEGMTYTMTLDYSVQ